MGNTFVENLYRVQEMGETANGAVALKSTGDKVYDLFARGGATRNMSENEIIDLFHKAYEDDNSLALKCLFYLGDCRGGQGERRLFRVCFKWLSQYHTTKAEYLARYIPIFRRWDDLIFSTYGTPVQDTMRTIVRLQLIEDSLDPHPSLLAKWMPSINASNKQAKEIANWFRKSFGYSPKGYRKMLVELREKINIVEQKITNGDWDNIEFDKLPSNAGLKYAPLFLKRDETRERYKEFIASKNTKVNVSALHPYDVAIACRKELEDEVVNKMWADLPDYINSENSIMTVVDLSGSMTSSYGGGRVRPIDVAVSLGIYTAERNKGEFHNKMVLFSRDPKFIELEEDKTFAQYYRKIISDCINENTDLIKTFALLRTAAQHANPEDVPKTLLIISDMQIDWQVSNSKSTLKTEMELERDKWTKAGLTMPHLVYWSVNAEYECGFLEGQLSDATFVSGCSPTIFKQIVSGVRGKDLMYETLLDERYKDIY